MAKEKIVFENPKTGMMKEAPVGFSWTVFFFGFFPALFRSDWKWAAIMFIAALCSFGLSSLFFMFTYNKFYIKDLINAGYKAKTIIGGDMEFTAAKLGMQIPQLETA